MNSSLPLIGGDHPLPAVQAVTCPRCNALLTVLRSSDPHIDDCGFESYSFACEQCSTPLAGIVDPADGALLLTDMAPDGLKPEMV